MDAILKEMGCNPATKHGRQKARKLAADPAQARKLIPEEGLSDEQATAKALLALAEYFKANKPVAIPPTANELPAVEAQPKGTDEMAKSKKKRTVKKRAARTARKDTKRSELLRLMERASGATMEELLDACGWTSCSNTIKVVAKKAGKKLVREKEKGKITRYYAK